MTARVKKEGVQALSLRLHKSTVKNVQGKYIFWQYCITGTFTRSLFSRFSDYIPLFRCFFSQLKSLSLWEMCGSIKTVHPCTVLMPEFCKQNSVLFCLPRPPEAVVFTAFKNPHRLYEKTSCFTVISQEFFHSWCPAGILYKGCLSVSYWKFAVTLSQVIYNNGALCYTFILHGC